MHYTIETTINRPREEFLELFQDEAFLKKWQVNLESLTVIEGEPGEIGSKSIFVYNQKGKVSQITETILRKDLPNQFDFLYEAKGVVNTANNLFVDQGDSTLWVADHEFQFSGFMKLLGLFKGMFVKQTTSDMKRFKELVEND